MSKEVSELTKARRQEIINACEQLYKEKGFKEINLKDIGERTSFTRTSIYNYFRTKEEIFLALLKRENELWVEDLIQIRRTNDVLSRIQLAEKLARSLEQRPEMLKILSMNLYDIEHNSSLEQLIEYKKTYKASIEELDACLMKFCTEMTKKEREEFIYSLLAFLYGIYPYTYITEKQKAAFEAVGLSFVYRTTYEVAFMGIKKLLEV